MIQLDHIVFIDTYRGKPDRGWSCQDAASSLDRNSIPWQLVLVRSAVELDEVIAARSRGCLYWPLSFTFDSDPASARIVDVLHASSCPYIGCTPSGSRLTSKLSFKEKLVAAGFAVPEFRVIENKSVDLSLFNYPAFLKAEFSCDSEGVRLVCNPGEAISAIHDLSSLFSNRFYLEAKAGGAEWTVGCLVIRGQCLSASLGLKAIDSDFIDSAAKSNNALLQISVPKGECLGQLSSYASQLVGRLGLSGYFRVDVLTDRNNTILPIDLNVLPHLNSADGHLSYLPMAFMLETGCSYDEVIAAVVATALGFDSKASPGSALENFLCSSKLVAKAGVRLR